MKVTAACVALVLLTRGSPVLADGREDLVRGYVDRIVVNSLDEPDRHRAYFTESQLLNDFSSDFVDTYANAVKASRRRGIRFYSKRIR